MPAAELAFTRIDVLRRINISATEPEALDGSATHLSHAVFDTPTAAISQVDSKGQWRSQGILKRSLSAMRGTVSLVSTIALGATAACTDQPAASPRLPGPSSFQTYVQQDQANNVQDWHRMAQRIADAMQTRGLLTGAEVRSDALTASRPAFFVRSAQQTPFVQELSRALRTELLNRQAPLATSPDGALVIDIAANVVVWGSRARSEPGRVRSEGIWYASLTAGNRILMAIQDPFYISSSDIAHYVQGSDLAVPARFVRSLQYSQ